MRHIVAMTVAALSSLPAGGLTAAQAQQHGGHGHHGPAASSSTTPMAAETASTKAYMAANDRMHAGMAISFSGDADVDFVKGMIPHHQGAVDMARIVLEHGKDPELRKLAEAIIKAQNDEIAFMTRWLASRPK